MVYSREPVVLQYIRGKWAIGHSLLILICGETNSGKSVTALTLASMLDPKFDPKTNVFVDMREFILKFINAEGEVFIIDEAKYHLDSGRWWEDINKFFGDIVATQRHRRNIYIVVLPLAKKLAKEHRDMIDVLIEMVSQGWAKTYIVKRMWGKIRGFEIWPMYMGNMTVSLPPDHIFKAYKEIEVLNKENILHNIIGRTLKKRRCTCGKKMDFLTNECDKCGFQWSSDSLEKLMYKYIKKKY